MAGDLSGLAPLFARITAGRQRQPSRSDRGTRGPCTSPGACRSRALRVFRWVLEREWLAPDGLCGFASGTIALANTRRYHVGVYRTPSETGFTFLLLTEVRTAPSSCLPGKAALGQFWDTPLVTLRDIK
jgi:hypothetical protein